MAHPGEYDSFKAPWGEGEIDPEKARRLVYNARLAEHEAQEKERAASAKVSEFEAKGLTADQQKDREIQALQAKIAESSAASLETARYRVALEEGLTAAQARRLVGASEAELAADAKAYKEEHGTGSGPNPAPPKQRPEAGRLQTGAGDAEVVEDLSDPLKLLGPRN